MSALRDTDCILCANPEEMLDAAAAAINRATGEIG